MITLVGLCAIGAEKVLGNEIKHLGYTLVPAATFASANSPATTVARAPGRVYFTASSPTSSAEMIFRANLCLRCADRVLLLVARFPAPDFEALFEGTRAAPWSDLVARGMRIVVDKVRSHNSTLVALHSVQSVVHKAIYTKLGETWHLKRLAETGETATVRVYIEENTAEVLLDLSGEPLHKRGYRTSGGTAPIRETLAAVLLQLALWRRKTPLLDPFCGSGTIPIEATLFALDAAPGFGRHFALEHLPLFDAKAAAAVRQKEAAKIRPDVLFRIQGSDIDPVAIKRSIANAEHACVCIGRALQEIGSDAKVPRPQFAVAEALVPTDSEGTDEIGLLLTNPPYGERLGDEAEATALYRKMSVLFDRYPGWSLGFITNHPTFEACIGKRAPLCKALTAGNLGTMLYLY
jgi:putative N6-adenine-specific DNA methylase